jgi:MoxR-like ATPase
MDRFLMHVYIDYPDEASEAEIIRLVRSEEGAANESAVSDGKPEPIHEQSVFDARREIAGLQIGQLIEKYIVDLVFATRYPDRYSEELARWIQIGASPRGGIALDKCSRVRAWLAGRDHVLPDDLRAVVHDCLRHRLTLSYEASADGVSANDVIDAILEQVAIAG